MSGGPRGEKKKVWIWARSQRRWNIAKDVKKWSPRSLGPAWVVAEFSVSLGRSDKRSGATKSMASPLII